MHKLLTGATGLLIASTCLVACNSGSRTRTVMVTPPAPVPSAIQGADIWANAKPTTLILGVVADLDLRSTTTASAIEAYFVKQRGTGMTAVTYLVYDTEAHLNDGLAAGEVDFALNSAWGVADMLQRTNGTAQAVLARDTDADYTSALVTKVASGITTVDQLFSQNRRILVSNSQDLEGSLLPIQYLQRQSRDFANVTVVGTDGAFDSLLYPVSSSAFTYADLRSAAPQADATFVGRDAIATLDSSLQVIWTSPVYQRAAWTALDSVAANKKTAFQSMMTSMTPADADAQKVFTSEKCTAWVIPTGASFADHLSALSLPALPRTAAAVMPPGSPAGDAQGSALTPMPALQPGIVLSGPNNKVKQFSAAQKWFRLRGTDLTFKLYDNRRTMVSAMLAGSGIDVGYMDSTNSTRLVDMAGRGNLTAILWGEVDAWNSADIVVDQTRNPGIVDAASMIAAGATIPVASEEGPGLYAGSNMNGITQLYWLEQQGHDISRLNVVTGAFSTANIGASAQGGPTAHGGGTPIPGLAQPVVAGVGHDSALELTTGGDSHHPEPLDTTQPLRVIFQSPYAGHCTFWSMLPAYTAKPAEIQRFQALMMEMTNEIVDPLQDIMELQEHRVWMPGPGFDTYVFEGMIAAHKRFGWRSDWAPGFKMPQ